MPAPTPVLYTVFVWRSATSIRALSLLEDRVAGCEEFSASDKLRDECGLYLRTLEVIYKGSEHRIFYEGDIRLWFEPPGYKPFQKASMPRCASFDVFKLHASFFSLNEATRAQFEAELQLGRGHWCYVLGAAQFTRSASQVS